MNKAVTDGVLLMPPPFADGLDVWSSGLGTPGSDTYENSANGVFVPADQDFGGALEVLKTNGTQRVRHMGQTPLLPGCYLRVTARIKAISGNLPRVRISGYPARANGTQAPGVPVFGPETPLTAYGEVVEVSAIIGAGVRGGVDLVWGTETIYGHLGIDLVGANGGVLRIDDLVVEDVTSVFLRDMLSVVDVRDYGAVGNGTTDDTAAFEAANADADGRTVYVPAGHFRLNSSVTFDTPVKFEGRVSMPASAILFLRRNYDLPSYIEAFEDEEVAFLKAFQALLNNSDHASLDMGGRKVWVTGPLDMQAAVPNRTSYATRRLIRNGQLEAAPSANWDTVVVTSQATYAPGTARTLSNVTNVANVPVGALVEGNGVGREVYVRSKNVATQEITLNQPLYDAAGTQNFTFRKFQYLVDFGGFSQLGKFGMDDVEFQCNSRCSAINLAPSGVTFQLRDCFISRPLDRGITSIGTGDQGMFIERCQFLSSEEALTVPNRSTIGFNANANDIKVRNNRATQFRHFGLIAGQNAIVTGNHFFQGDTIDNGIRSAGLILTETYTSSVLSQNYVDNCFIEWTNEHDPNPQFTGGFSFSSLGITDNIFLSGEVAPWFSYIVVKPHGAGHFLNGVNITGNRFRSINGAIDRAERVDTTFSDLDMARAKNVVMTGNSYHNVDAQVENGADIRFTQNSNSNGWMIDCSDKLPFGGQALSVDAVVPLGPIRNGGNFAVYHAPFAQLIQGANRDQVRISWPEAVRGTVQVKVRMDSR
ncbi:glycosyl hydrolase family 28-related protein [Sulfitobacter aestuariivivens]|uniref:Right-handed parallel beta-helix repeat-containing protein n=1 Tax=Sulfitobacter aestuariivivens TaxID=2766981 RepID=A0A927HGF0_9RHOB|nr:glycosyl hydrolase family 28-related protein [Sulfitobacter aestuariivivens]MBD3665906.1 right-handed parallel beta-helix repeat-containing protein [Sulfitobacter aestuariivivens]